MNEGLKWDRKGRVMVRGKRGEKDGKMRWKKGSKEEKENKRRE